MPIKNMTAGLNAASDFFNDMRGMAREDASDDREERRLKLQEEGQILDADYQQQGREIERKRTQLAESKLKADALEKERIETQKKAEQEAAVWRMRQPSVTSSIDETLQRVSTRMPFGIGQAIGGASRKAAEQLLDTMDPASAAAFIAHAHKRRAAKRASTLSGPALQSFLREVDDDANREIDEALSRRIGGMVQRASNTGVLGSTGADGQADNSAADMLQTLAVTDPRKALEIFTNLTKSAAKERAWLGFHTSEMAKGETALQEKLQGLDSDATARAHDALEDMRSAQTEAQMRDSREKLNDILNGKGRKVSIQTGKGSIDIEDPEYRIKRGGVTDREIEARLAPAAMAVFAAAPDGMLELDGSRGQRKLAVLRTMNQVSQQLGMKRHPALALAQGVETLEAMLADEMDEDPTFGAVKYDPKATGDAAVAQDAARAKAVANTGLIGKARYQRALKLADEVDGALREGGVYDGVMSPEGRIKAWMIRNGADTLQVDRDAMGDGFELAAAALKARPEVPTDVVVQETLRALRARAEKAGRIPPPEGK